MPKLSWTGIGGICRWATTLGTEALTRESNSRDMNVKQSLGCVSALHVLSDEEALVLGCCLDCDVLVFRHCGFRRDAVPRSFLHCLRGVVILLKRYAVLTLYQQSGLDGSMKKRNGVEEQEDVWVLRGCGKSICCARINFSLCFSPPASSMVFQLLLFPSLIV